MSIGICGAVGLTSGCGTILYPERIGQAPGPLDWKVVALNTVGLLLFIVPGVVAFAVDFYNRTIYLPQYYGAAPRYGAAPDAGANRPLVSLVVPENDLTLDGVQRVVSRHVDRSVHLVPGQYQTKELESVDQFWATYDAIVAA